MNRKTYSRKVKQLRLIWVGARTLDLDTDAIHALLKSLTGQESLSHATDFQREILIRDLEAKAAFKFQSPRQAAAEKGGDKSPHSKGTATDLITESQSNYITDLWTKLAALAPDFAKPGYRAGFTKKLLGESRPWPQTRGEAATLIEALKRRLRQVTERACREEAGGVTPPAPPRKEQP